MNLSPALTKNEMRPTTLPNVCASTSPDAFTASSTATAVASANATSCTGVAPASCRWYEQMFTGFHCGQLATVHATVSVVSRNDGPGGETEVPRARDCLTMSLCVGPVQWAGS